ncbi:MAG: hypothetical protein RLZZ329_985 [Pseudomonadota bacterium]
MNEGTATPCKAPIATTSLRSCWQRAITPEKWLSISKLSSAGERSWVSARVRFECLRASARE